MTQRDPARMSFEERLALCHAALLAQTPAAFVAQVRQAYATERHLDKVEALAAAIFGETDVLPDGLDSAAQDAPFVAAMRAVLARRAGAAGAWPAVLEIGEDLDFLEKRCRATQMTLVQFCCLALQQRRAASRQVAVVMMARDEGIYLPEWLAHTRLIGAERVFVYTNDNADGSDALLQAMADEGLIVLVRNRLAPGVNPQRKAYQHAVLLLDELRDYRWAMFIDADEFPYFGDVAPGALGRMLDEVESGGGDPPAGVFLPWRWRVTDRQYHRQGIAVLPAYPYAWDRPEGKAAVRLAAVESMCAVHWPEGAPPCRMVDGMGRELPEGWQQQGVERPYAGPAVEHYWAKSFVEYAVKKRRGEALALESRLFLRGWDEFFNWTGYWVQNLHHPLAPGWLARVAAETAAILARPAVAAAYAAVERQYRAMADAALRDTELFAVYHHRFLRVDPSFR